MNMLEQIKQIKNPEDLTALHSSVFGKNGTMTVRLKDMKNLDNDSRAALNAESAELRDAFKHAQEELEHAAMMNALESQKLDAAAITGYGLRVTDNGRLHPLSQCMSEVSTVLTEMGYSLRTGPEIEDDWHNFTALNTPPHHPARDMQDTFFVSGGNVMRTQTSAVQIRSMEKDGVPIKIFSAGTTYRREMDATHSPMFHQIEGLVVDRRITLSDMVGDIKTFLERFFERELNMRIRPSYFPFTEPSVEIDVEWKPGKWLEIMGAGMVHPNVLCNVKINPNEFQGFAFGFGLDRLAMLKYGLSDIREFFGGDARWLKANGFETLGDKK
ncbi:MAG: phenylalanine--tRNA ligase subunit alpha [Alphaproteobacteria bacterium]|nr:phenylalanine--tRNA ligase subunit alpha [Alphaproteobacteria bacterium]